MLNRLMNNLTSPVAWGADFVRYMIFRALEVRNVMGLADMLQPGTSNGS